MFHLGWYGSVGASCHNQMVIGSIPSQGTYLGCGFDPMSRHIKEATNQYFSLTSVFHSFPSSLPSSLSKSNKKKNVLG